MTRGKGSQDDNQDIELRFRKDLTPIILTHLKILRADIAKLLTHKHFYKQLEENSQYDELLRELRRDFYNSISELRGLENLLYLQAIEFLGIPENKLRGILREEKSRSLIACQKELRELLI